MAEFVEAILAQIIGNLSTALIIIIFYFNFLLFESYLRLIVWAILFSQALRQAKNSVIAVLQYLSSDPDVAKSGFLTCVFTKSCEIFLYNPYGTRRSAKEMFLNYGIFLFSLIGAVSVWLRMFSWASFFHTMFGFWLITLSLIKILDRRIFYYRYFISDEVLVSSLLMLGFFSTGIFVIFYLGTETYMEGSRAAADVSNWIQKNFINDERTRELWSEQVENSRAMMSAALSGIEDNYNDTMWWPPVKGLVKTFYLDSKAGDGNTTAMTPFYSRLSLPENMTLVEAVTLAYSKVDSVNLTSVQLTDWTTKGLEVSSIAFGSVAQLIFLVFTLVIAFVSLGIRSFFFLSSMFYLLSTKWDPIERFIEDLLPIQVDKRPQVVHSLRKVVEGVFFLPLKMASLHALVTLVSFTMVNADFVYLATTFTFFISIVPIIPPYLVCLPWVFSIWVTSSFLKAIALFAVQYFAFTMLDDMLYEKSIVALNSYVSALSVVFGVYVFGIEGVIFGPLSVCAVTFAYEVSNHGIQAAQDEYFRASEDLRNFNQDDEDAEEPTSIGSSFDEEDDVPGTPPREARSPNTNIFSDAMYRVISGPLVDRVRRRLSMDISTDDSVCVTLLVDGLKTQRRVRFVVNKTWSQRMFYEHLRRTLRVHAVEGVTDTDDVEVLSPLHIMPNEVLKVRVRSKTRPPLFPDNVGGNDSHARVLSPHYRLGLGSNSPSKFSKSTTDLSMQVEAPLSVSKGKMVPVVTLPLGSSITTKHSKGRLRRQLSVPIRADGEIPVRRRGSYGSEAITDTKSTRPSQSASTFEDVAPLLSFKVAQDGSEVTLEPSNPDSLKPLELGDLGHDFEVLSPTKKECEEQNQSSMKTDSPVSPAPLKGSESIANKHTKGKKNRDKTDNDRRSDKKDVKAAGNRNKLLYSPVCLKDGSLSYPSDDEDHAN